MRVPNLMITASPQIIAEPSRFRREFGCLSETEIGAIWNNLLLYARLHFDWLSDRVDLEGVVQESLIGAWKGERCWRESDQMLKFVQGIIQSKINHIYVRESMKKIGEDGTRVRLPRTVSLQDLEDRPGHRELPGLIHHDDVLGRIELRELHELIHQELGDRLAEIFDLDEEGLKPREIAAELEAPITEVRNGRKRIHRKLANYPRSKK